MSSLTKIQKERRRELRAKLTKPKKRKTKNKITHGASGVATLCGWPLENNVVIGRRVTCKRCLEVIAMRKRHLVHAPYPDLMSMKLTLCGWNRTYTELVVGDNVTCKRCLECIAKRDSKIVHRDGGVYTMCGAEAKNVEVSKREVDVSCKRCLSVK